MAKKYSGGIRIIAGFKLDDPQPIDDRLVVTSSNSLTDPNFTNIYPGIIVSVSGSNGSAYKWNGEDRTNISNWEKILVSSDTSSFAQTSNVVSNTTFNAFSSSYSQSVVDFNTFSSSIAESVSTKAITASSGIFFTSSEAGPKNYRIDYAKFFSASSDVLVPSSGSLTITASGIQISGDLDASGSVTLQGALSFNGFNFTETSVSNISGSTAFGSGSDPSSASHQFTGSVLITGSNLTLVGGTLIIPNNAGDGTINVASVLANTATATNVVTNSTFNAFSSSYSQSVVDFIDTSGSIATEIDNFQSFSSSFSQSVIDFNSFSSSFSQSVVNFTSASESIATEIDNFQSFSSSFSQSVIDFNSFSSSFSQSVVNFDTTSASMASEIADFQSFSSSFSQSVVNFDTTSASMASEIADFQSFSSSFSQSVVNFNTTSASMASEIADFQSFSSSFSQSVVDFNIFSSSISESFTTTNITASNISASGNLFLSASLNSSPNLVTLMYDTASGQIFHTGSYGGGGGGSSVATEITLGADTTGNLSLIASTTVQSSIDQINSVLDLLAPTVPSSLSAVSLGFFGTTNYSAIDKDGNTVSSITNDTSPSFVTSTEFFDGDNGVLSAQHFPSSSGAIGTGYNSNFPSSSINLTTGDDTGTDGILQIVSNTDPYVGQAGSANFYTVLSARINLSGLTANNVGDYQRNTVRLIHTQTGPNGIDKEFTIDSDPASSVTDLNFTYNETYNFHYQSGIKYLGNDNSILAHYNVTIDSNANFINTNGTIAQVVDSPDVLGNGTKTVSSFTPGQSYNVTHSLDVNDTKFNRGNVTLLGRNFKASSTTFATNQDSTTISGLLIDSKQEDETKPNNGASLPLRVKSGKGQYPSFGTSTGTFGDTFITSSELTTSDEYELQFANEYFHWPASTNYSGYIPAGPDYSSISGDDTSGFTGRRYATFKLGDISEATSLTVNIVGAYGFDNTLVQTEDNFQFHLMIVDSTTPVTNWMNLNAVYDNEFGDPTDTNGKPCLTGGTEASSGTLARNVTFAAGGIQTGTVYVRIGWSVDGETNPTSTSTRMFKYITKS